MAETARLGEELPDPVETKPSLQLVRDTLDADTAPAGAAAEPNLGRSAVVGYLIGFVVTVVAITVTGTLGGFGFGSALGLGTFVGVWGGGGFGFMMGGTVPFARHLDAQARSTHHGQGGPMALLLGDTAPDFTAESTP